MKTNRMFFKVFCGIFILFSLSFNSCEEADTLFGCKNCSKPGEKDVHTCDKQDILIRENHG